jgi:hypothetical protein
MTNVHCYVIQHNFIKKCPTRFEVSHQQLNSEQEITDTEFKILHCCRHLFIYLFQLVF